MKRLVMKITITQHTQLHFLYVYYKQCDYNHKVTEKPFCIVYYKQILPLITFTLSDKDTTKTGFTELAAMAFC